MSLRFPLALPLLSLVLAIPPATHAQSCNELLQQAARQQVGGAVSVANLRIPPKAWKHFEKARQAATLDKADVFEREAAEALAVSPEFAQVYLLRAAQELHAGKPMAALETVAQARSLQSTLPWSGVLAASALNRLQRFDDAVKELARAPREESESWQGKYERARAETGRRNLDAALQWSELAVAAAPAGCTDARLVRANALQLGGRRMEVVTELETYLALDRLGTRRVQVLAALELARESLRQEGGGMVAMR